MLRLMVLSCLLYPISHGFHFDNFIGAVTVGIPITLLWHRDVNDTDPNIVFGLQSVDNHAIGRSSFSPTNATLTPPDGTLNVTFTLAGEYVIGAFDHIGATVATQTFNVADADRAVTSTEIVSMSTAVLSAIITTLFVSLSSDSEPYSSSAKSVQSTATTPPSSNPIHPNHKTSIIIGAVIGCLVSLLVIFGGGTFLFIRKRRHPNWNLKHRLSPNLKIIPELNSLSPPVGNKNGEVIAPMMVGETAPNFGDRNQEIVGQNLGENPTEDNRERRDSISTPVHIYTSVLQSTPEQEGPQAALDDVVVEVVRLRTQFQQFIVEREAERVHGNALDPPPAYA